MHTRGDGVHSASGHAQKAVLFVLWAHEGEAMSYGWIAAKAGCSYSVVLYALRALCRNGLVARERRARTKSRAYTLNRTKMRAMSMFRPGQDRAMQVREAAERSSESGGRV